MTGEVITVAYSRMDYDKLKRKLKKQQRQKRRLGLLSLMMILLLIGLSGFWYPLLTEYLPSTPNTKEKETLVTSETTTEITETTTETESEPTQAAFSPRFPMTKPAQVPALFSPLTNSLETLISEQEVSGSILAVKNNQVILYDNYGAAAQVSKDPTTSTYMLASMQKSITALLVMKQIEAGHLTLKTTLDNFYPAIPNSENITIDQLLSMTSGLYLDDRLNDTTSTKMSLDYMEQHVVYRPMTAWKYSFVNYTLLASIIEKVSDASYEENFNTAIKEPLHLQETGFYTDDTAYDHMILSQQYKDGKLQEPKKIKEAALINEFGTGNMYTSVGDYLVIFQSLLDGHILSPTSLHALLTREPEPYNYLYKAGLYETDSGYRAHGVFRGYEPTMQLSADGSDAVIFFSNIYTEDARNMTLVNTMYNTLHAYMVTKP